MEQHQTGNVGRCQDVRVSHGLSRYNVNVFVALIDVSAKKMSAITKDRILEVVRVLFDMHTCIWGLHGSVCKAKGKVS